MSSTPKAPPSTAGILGPTWILGPLRDLALLIATPIAVFPILLFASRFLGWDGLGLVVLAFATIGHHLPALLLAYGDGRVHTRYASRLLLYPVLFVLLSLQGAANDIVAVEIVATIWGLWHVTRQAFGIGRLYDARGAHPDAGGRRLELAVWLLWFGGGVLLSPVRLGGLLETTMRAGLPIPDRSTLTGLQIAWTVAMLGVTVAYAVRLRSRFVAGTPPNPAKLIFLGASLLWWWLTCVGISHMVVGIALYEVFHAVQLVTLGHVLGQGRARSNDSPSGMNRFLFAASPLALVAYVGATLAFGLLAYLALQVRDPILADFMGSLLLGSALLHYYVSGVTWGMREAGVRQALGLGGDEDVQPVTRQLSLGEELRTTHGKLCAALLLSYAALVWFQYRAEPPGEERYERLIETLPSYPRGHLLAGTAVEEFGRYQEAYDRYRAAIALQPDYEEAIMRRELILASAAAPEDRLRHLERAREIAPQSYLVDLATARYHASLGDYSKAEKCYRESIARRPGDARARKELGYLMHERGYFNEAVDFLKEARELDPRDGKPCAVLGDLFAYRGSAKAAREFYQEALQRDPKNAVYWYNMGMISQRIGEVPRSAGYFAQALELDPRLLRAQAALGKSYEAMGELESAVLHFEEALAIEPTHIESLERLAWIRAGQSLDTVGDGAKAIELATRYRELRGKLPECYDLLAAAHAQAGDFERATQLAAALLQLLENLGDEAKAVDIRAKLALYQAGKPYRQPQRTE